VGQAAGVAELIEVSIAARPSPGWSVRRRDRRRGQYSSVLDEELCGTGSGTLRYVTSAADGLVLRIGAGPRPADDRWTRQRVAIVEAATSLFLQRGYPATSTGEVATAAKVSKQTVYRHFGDKEGLFREIVLGVTVNAEQFVDGLGPALAAATTPGQLREALVGLARRRLVVTTDPQVVAARRLVIGEATRFPDLAREFGRRGPIAVVEALAAAFAELDGRGLLRVDDPHSAAGHFAYLANGRHLDAAMFDVDTAALDGAGVERAATAAVEVFLAAYG
jgi:TetR/AcrR family transcriptional regulator, mexJK operon transcriptional repressor